MSRIELTLKQQLEKEFDLIPPEKLFEMAKALSSKTRAYAFEPGANLFTRKELGVFLSKYRGNLQISITRAKALNNLFFIAPNKKIIISSIIRYGCEEKKIHFSKIFEGVEGVYNFGGNHIIAKPIGYCNHENLSIIFQTSSGILIPVGINQKGEILAGPA